MQGNRKSIRLGAVWLNAAWLIAAAFASTASNAAPIFSDIYVIGDSLSDTGNNEIVAPGGDIPGTDFTYGDNGRFANGPVWAEYLSDNLGLGPLKPSRAGGNNYAHGGAGIDFRGGPETGLLAQYQHYKEDRGPRGADSDALYIVWGGANELREKIGPESDPVAVIGNSMAAYRGMLSDLIATGADHLLVPNLPNLGRTPEARMAGVAGQVTQLSLLWNSFLDGMLGGLQQETGANIYTYDTFSLLEGVFANAESLGFTNTTDPCSTVRNNVEIPCDNPDEYIFWDILHPTTAVHELIGEGATDLLISQGPVDVPVPSPISLLIPGLGLILLRRTLAKIPKAG